MFLLIGPCPFDAHVRTTIAIIWKDKLTHYIITTGWVPPVCETVKQFPFSAWFFPLSSLVSFLFSNLAVIWFLFHAISGRNKEREKVPNWPSMENVETERASPSENTSYCSNFSKWMVQFLIKALLLHFCRLWVTNAEKKAKLLSTPTTLA